MKPQPLFYWLTVLYQHIQRYQYKVFGLDFPKILQPAYQHMGYPVAC